MRKRLRIQENSEDIPLAFRSITELQLDENSRDPVTRTLIGVQAVYRDHDARVKVIDAVERMLYDDGAPNRGRQGLDYWSVFVLGVLRLSCNWSYDMLANISNNHRDLRAMIGLDSWLEKDKRFSRQSLHDNLSRLTAEGWEQIRDIVVEFSYKELSLCSKEIHCRCDSFVVDSNVEYPTDMRLLLDCVCKSIDLTVQLEKLFPAYEAIDTFLFTPGCTSALAALARMATIRVPSKT